MGCCHPRSHIRAWHRVALVVLWLASPYPDMAFQGWFWPLLGFFFMPWTTLTYLGAMVNAGGVNGIWLVLFIIAVLLDIGSHGSTEAQRRRRFSDRR
ncbi:MAG: hypothetical protein U5N86_01850 [Planctomycetota bacterium]|nr:hypothetical protein [Planctomycetota bacterium]